jgi:hypothetical protein
MVPRRTVLHFESAGSGAAEYPVEVGIALADRRTLCCLIRPYETWSSWSSAKEAVHGITLALLHTNGREPRQVAEWMNAELHGQSVYCDDWDRTASLLHTLYKAADAGPPSFHLTSIDELLGPIPVEAWREETLDVKQSGGMRRHRASYEARVRQIALSELIADMTRDSFYPDAVPQKPRLHVVAGGR